MSKKQNLAGRIRNKLLLDQIASARIRLYDKLINLDFRSLNISEYNQKYLESKMAGIKAELQLYASYSIFP